MSLFHTASGPAHRFTEHIKSGHSSTNGEECYAVSQSEWFTSSCCPPDARDQQARSPLAPGVCVILFVPLFPRWVPLLIYLRQPAPSPDNPPLPPHPFFFQRQTQAWSLKLIHCVNVIFLPDFLCVSLSLPTPANQNADASRVSVALSPVHTGRGGWSPPSAVSPPRFLLFSTSTTSLCLPPLWIQALLVSLSLYAIRDAPDYLRYPLMSFLLL